MQKRSWNTLIPSFERYAYTDAVGRFVERATQDLSPVALILFGSLARNDYHQRSDADFCVILPTSPRSLFDGYDQVVACDPSGVVQPVVYGAEQFRHVYARPMVWPWKSWRMAYSWPVRRHFGSRSNGWLYALGSSWASSAHPPVGASLTLN